MKLITFSIIFLSSFFFSCTNNKITISQESNIQSIIQNSTSKEIIPKSNQKKQLIIGATQTEKYFDLIKNKRVGMIVNHTSMLYQENDTVHLVDFLLQNKINIQTIFAPEHGFRGTASAGETIKNGKDTKTGIDIISLYGKNKKPTKEQLKNIDILIFDIQDVGARFYTYISTMHYCMEAAAENNKQIIILDRPNPNGFYIDGSIREEKYKSFVGMHPIPIVHALTVGELAKMIEGEKWLQNDKKEIIQLGENLKIISCQNYSHKDNYTLNIAPSPNLPTQNSILLYPSLCLFEGTKMSVGRGTDFPFEVVAHPNFPQKTASISFTPKPNEGAKYPPFKNKICYGIDYQNQKLESNFSLKPILEFYQIMKNENLEGKKDIFFNSYFNTLVGNDKLQNQIKEGLTEQEIKQTWLEGLDNYKIIRKKYLLYKDFE
ncbi:hypothetical protein Fleli_2656 [Bernardetia litoralis DSM 6794]|uniref:DUF1343 domain-containing protein n=1 Tax=Bernardetia litoralis (strain ATCC 23117 / DSM 6794 / NBRC 15988 / NCIMB 1366 / Fx l1 / Sio-4) TaxID=880071 RepID=I4AM31_BERLS|nr:DUF1343 domain-containing protein [Bernardetia litoralis]AFM05016.1 hypothetical protein Fleli_2656 [Bernardetia litoralis DSM 6794]